MTDLKPGDRVRVEFDGVLVGMPMGSGQTYIRADGKSATVLAYAEHCTILPPLAKVGDVVDYDTLDALPFRSVVRDDYADIGSKAGGGWSVAGFTNLQDSTFFSQPVTVLWLPE